MKALARLSLISFLLLSLTACGLFGGKKEVEREPSPLVSFNQERKIDTVWSVRVGDGSGESYLRLEPAIDGDQLYIADASGLVAAYDKKTGKRTWKNNLKTPVSGGVGAGFDRVFVVTTNGEVVALNQAGQEVWRADVTSEVVVAPQTNGDIVVVQTLDEKIYAFDHKSGKHRWTYESILPKLTLRGTSTPVVTLDYIIAGFANGKVVVLNPETGRAHWERRLASPQGRSELDRMIDVDGTPVVAGEVVYATSFQGNAAAIELRTAKILWQTELSSFLSPDESLGNVYVVDDNDIVYALKKESSENVWGQVSLEYRQVTAPVVYGNYVAVGDAQGYLHFISQNDGRFIARKKIDGDGIRSNPIAQDGLLYVYGNSGKLVALSLK